MNAWTRAVPIPTVSTRTVTPAAAGHSSRDADAVDPALEELVRGAVAIGIVLLLLLPAARGHHAQFGWLPLWLLAMPLSAWWALHGFRLPARARSASATAHGRRPRSGPQARRRARPRQPQSLPRAA